MKFGISSLLFIRLPLEKAISLAHEFGYECIEIIYEIPHFDFRSDSKKIEELKRLLQGYGMDVSVHSSFVDLNPVSHHREIFELNRKCLEKSMAVCKRLGGEIVVAHTGVCRVPMLREFWEKTKRKCFQLLRSASLYAKKLGVKLAVENGSSRASPFSKPRELRDLAERIDGGIAYDVGHACLREREDGKKLNVSKALEEIKDRLVHIHVHDNRGKDDDHMVPGKGHIDFESMGKTLRRIGYRNMIIAELWDPEDPIGVAREGIKSLRRYFR